MLYISTPSSLDDRLEIKKSRHALSKSSSSLQTQGFMKLSKERVKNYNSLRQVKHLGLPNATTSSTT